jgi:Ser/Thr protein kinase RdoA (MazF antagonist)
MKHQDGDPLDTAWFGATYGIWWCIAPTRLGGRLAKVFAILDETSRKQLVVRLSDPSRIGESRITQVHRFMRYISGPGVPLALPMRTQDDRTFAVHRKRGYLAEVFPFIEGRHPTPGDVGDAARVATAMAAFHNRGAEYEDLPGEESCDQNHVALERLRRDVSEARERSAGELFEPLLSEYLTGAELVIDELQSLREDLVETCLHLDVSPGNVILRANDRVGFIDCSHAARGRRAFDVLTALYYMDLSSQAGFGEPGRYEDIDPDLESAFLSSYRSACSPPWKPAEDHAYRLEKRLLLIHAAAYWVLELGLAEVERRLVGYRDLNRKRQRSVAATESVLAGVIAK